VKIKLFPCSTFQVLAASLKAARTTLESPELNKQIAGFF
jgi:hypothetical protein